MPLNLSIDDFKLTRAVCEIRYDSAYLIYDKTGLIIQRMQSEFPDLDVITATPNNSIFRTPDHAFGLELGQSRLSADKPEWSLEKFGGDCQTFFDTVSECLDAKVFTRVGLRVFFRRDFSTFEESRNAIGAMKLLNLETGYFGIENPVQELVMRWTNEEVGTTLRLAAESGKLELVLPPELESKETVVHKKVTGVVVDVDYYTVAPVERSQWDASSWIPQSIRRIRKEADKIISR